MHTTGAGDLARKEVRARKQYLKAMGGRGLRKAFSSWEHGGCVEGRANQQPRGDSEEK